MIISYTGGKYTFLRFEGVSTANYGAAFYTNAQVISDYQVRPPLWPESHQEADQMWIC